MIKKILVALDPDSDTAVAVRYAVDMARRFDAEITAVAVIDMGSIDASTRGGGIGSMYYADVLRQQLTNEAREQALRIVDRFKGLVEQAGVRFSELVQEGVPFERLVEDMKYHDLLVVGKEPHFFYSHPKQATETLARLVGTTVGPTFIVPDELRPVERVLIAYDGSSAAARAMRSFVHLHPFGKDVRIRVLAVHKGDDSDAKMSVSFADQFLKAHGFEAHMAVVQSDHVNRTILDHVGEFNTDLVVAGAHSKSFLRTIAFGSTTAHLVKQCPVPLFLEN